MKGRAGRRNNGHHCQRVARCGATRRRSDKIGAAPLSPAPPFIGAVVVGTSLPFSQCAVLEPLCYLSWPRYPKGQHRLLVPRQRNYSCQRREKPSRGWHEAARYIRLRLSRPFENRFHHFQPSIATTTFYGSISCFFYLPSIEIYSPNFII